MGANFTLAKVHVSPNLNFNIQEALSTPSYYKKPMVYIP